jgi:hypothetical protein
MWQMKDVVLWQQDKSFGKSYLAMTTPTRKVEWLVFGNTLTKFMRLAIGQAKKTTQAHSEGKKTP